MIGERIYSGSPYEEKAGYARAVVVDGWVLVSGTTGFDPETKLFPEGVEAQCENCFRNIARALEEAGASLGDLVRVQIFVTSQEEFQRIMPIIRKHCDAARPTNTTVLAQLVAPHMRVEIEATARIPRAA
jgi:enamine deaminase RidA (YjgF/YER057c/UK114 family)